MMKTCSDNSTAAFLHFGKKKTDENIHYNDSGKILTKHNSLEDKFTNNNKLLNVFPITIIYFITNSN